MFVNPDQNGDGATHTKRIFTKSSQVYPLFISIRSNAVNKVQTKCKVLEGRTFSKQLTDTLLEIVCSVSFKII